MLEAILEGIFEVVLEVLATTIFEPIDEWISRILDKKVKKYSKFLRGVIKTVVYIILTVVTLISTLGLICLFIAVTAIITYSYMQRAGLVSPKSSGLFADVCIIVNTLSLASALYLSTRKPKAKKYENAAIVFSSIVFTCNVIFLIITN